MQRQKYLTPAELAEVREILNRPDLFIREETLQKVYETSKLSLSELLLSILEHKTDQIPSRAQLIEEAVEQFLEQHLRFTQAQRQFIYGLRSLLVRQARGGVPLPLTLERLNQPPFNRIGQSKNLFTGQELAEILQFANEHISQIA